jgi:hypothetical protein
MADGTTGILERKVPAKNTWSRDQEELLAEWSDKAACYRWLHDRTEKIYSRYNAMFTIPVIILSTLTGTANFGMDSIFPPGLAGIAQLGIGAVSLITGMISTVANFLRYAQGMEAHRVSGVSWGKLQRKIAVELALSPTQRVDSMDFLKLCRAEMDRLIEQSPPIPDDVIQAFLRTFPDKNLRKPEICNQIEHTHIYEGKDEKLAAVTAAAASIMRNNRKADINKLVHTPDIRKEIVKEIAERATHPPPNPDVKIAEELASIRASGAVSRWKTATSKVITPITTPPLLDEPSISKLDETSVPTRTNPLFAAVRVMPDMPEPPTVDDVHVPIHVEPPGLPEEEHPPERTNPDTGGENRNTEQS